MNTKADAEQKAYTLYHPRWYRPRVSTYWWLGSWPYSKFILRELSSIAVAWTAVVMLFLIRAIAHGPGAYVHFLQVMRNPILVTINFVSLLFVLFHTITWFNLTPHAMSVRVGGRRVPGILLSGPNYVLWLAVSFAIAWVLMR